MLEATESNKEILSCENLNENNIEDTNTTSKEDLKNLTENLSTDKKMPQQQQKTELIDVGIPIISISDAEDVPIKEVILTPATIAPGKNKKRSITSDNNQSITTGENDELNPAKRKKHKVTGGPKKPLNSFVRYMNERRESLRKEHPEKSSIDHTRMIGEEWNHLPKERKAPYNEAADLDRQRYQAQLREFLKSNPKTVKNKKLKKEEKSNKTLSPNSKNKDKEELNGQEVIAMLQPTTPLQPTSPPPPQQQQNDTIEQKSASISPTNAHNMPLNTECHNTNNNGTTYTVGEIPIFTNEFLEHNKAFDMELRSLRKTKIDLEQQNSVLEKHVENMKSGVKKLTNENNELQEKNRLLQIYLEKMKFRLAKALSGLAIPTQPNGATTENIDKYMHDLYTMATSNTHGPASLNKAKDIIRKLDLHIQL